MTRPRQAENLVKIGLFREEAHSKDEIAGCLRLAAGHLKVAKSDDFDVSVRFLNACELASVMPRAKLAVKFHASGFTTHELIVSYAQVVTVTAPALLTGQVSRDPKDDHVLACALAAGADLIVSGDSDLLNLKSYQSIPIVDAAETLRRIESESR